MDSVFATRLKECLAQNGISQQKLAEKVGVSPSAVSKWIVAGNSIDSQNLLKVCQELKVSADYLLGLTDSPQTTPNIEREISDMTGLSDSSIRTLHEKLISNRAEAETMREIINLALTNPLFYDWLNCIDDYCTKYACSTSDYREQVNTIRDTLLDLTRNDQLLYIELNDYFFGETFRDKAFSDAGFSEADGKNVEKYQYNSRVKEQNLALFTLTDTSSRLARRIASKKFDRLFQESIVEHLQSISRWIDLCAANNYSLYHTSIQNDGSTVELTYEEFLKKDYPSYTAFSKQIETELRKAASLSKKKKGAQQSIDCVPSWHGL